jgi:hypothetical protein
MDTFSPGISDNSRTNHAVIKRSRAEVANCIVDFKAEISRLASQRAAAASLGIPRSTWRHWRDRQAEIALPAKTIEFFESPEGTDFLHLLMTSLLLVMAQLGNNGIRSISLVLKLCQLDHFVGSSYGSIQKSTVQMEDVIEEYGKQERESLSANMEAKAITMCGDETFHPQTCLVAIEPVSNFIMAEQYSEKRDALSWANAMSAGLADLPITIVQSTSDEGKGLLKYVKDELGAHHSPDLFHVQQDLTRATSAPLNAQVRHAETAYQASSEKTKQWVEERQQSIVAEAGRGRPFDYDIRIAEAKVTEADALQYLKECEERQALAKKAKKAIGVVYHPYNLKTGKPQTAKIVGAKLEKQFDIIQSVSDEAGLSENSQKQLEKAHRVFPQLTITISFFWAMVKTLLAKLGLSKELETLMREILIPSCYLQMASKKINGAKRKHKIMALAQALRDQLEANDLWQALAKNQREAMEASAQRCAELFQRSSSCVEGRNGYLSLRHHGLHKLSNRKLSVLTTLHNYYITRADSTTAAERFFGKKPRDLFEVLLKKLRYPPRPRSQHKMVA